MAQYDPFRGSKPKKVEPEVEETAVEEQDENAVPSGTTKEVLAWVGEDKDRAQRALDKEKADKKPRTGLTKELEELLDQ